jgi:hypothetical protein
MPKRLILFFVCLIYIAVFAVDAFACACCAEPGTYSIWTGKPDSYYLGVIGGIEFEKNAHLYMTEAGFDGIKGLGMIEKEYENGSWVASPGELDLVAVFTRKVWTFTIKTKGGKSGILTLPLPAQMLTFKVDIHDEDDRPNGPLLYKEFRFKGGVSSASGFTRPAFARGTTYFLVFQGRGNGCDNASDFTHWRLEIEGPNTDYAFFGKLKAHSPQ